QCVTKAKAATTGSRPHCLFLFFACFLTAALARQCFLHPFLLTGLQVKGVTFHFLNDVFLLHLPLEATQGVFQRFVFLQSDFCQRNYTPKPVLLDSLVIARRACKVKQYVRFWPLFDKVCWIRFLSLGVVLETYPQGKLNLPGCVSPGRMHKIRRDLVISREVTDSKLLSVQLELGGVAKGAIIRKLEPFVRAIEQIK